MADITEDMRATLADLDQARITAADGRVSGRLGLVTSLFFGTGSTEAGQMAALRTLSGLAGASEAEPSSMQCPGRGVEAFEPTRFAAETAAAIRAAFARGPAKPGSSGHDLDIGLFADPDPHERHGDISLPFGTVAASPPLLEGFANLSHLLWCEPIGTLVNRGPMAILFQTLAACSQLRPLHGLVGFGVVFNPFSYSDTDGVAAFPFTKRFRGLHNGQDGTFKVQAGMAGEGAGLMSINWLTVLGDEALKALGGPETLGDLPEDCTVHGYRGGVIVQAGTLPQTGDRNRALPLPAYAAVAQTLEPVTFSKYTLPVFPVPQPCDPLAETMAWVHRFA